MKNIMVCGLYYSGSGAVTDLLREYEGVACVEGEFDDIRRAGMLGDGVTGKMRSENISAACCGIWHPVYESDFKYHIRQIIKKILLKLPLPLINSKGLNANAKARAKLLKNSAKNIRMETSQENKIKFLKDHINSVAAIYSKIGDTHVLFDQPIFLNSHQDIWPEVFDPFRLIIVYRDPRDQIAQIIKEGLINFDIETPTRGLLEVYGDNRIGSIKYELDMAQARFKNALRIKQFLGRDRVMLIAFEDMVRNYDIKKYEIESFVQLDSEKHIRKKALFDPEKSIKNIGIYKDYLSDNELALFKAIKIFETEQN